MSRRLRYWTLARDWLVAILGISALVGALFFAFRDPKPAERVLAITAGSLRSERSRVVEALAKEVKAKGLHLHEVATDGSEAAIQKLAEPGTVLDLALVQGGLHLTPEQASRIRQVAALMEEPLHLLVKGQDLLDQVKADGLPALRGKTVNLSTPGSGTQRLATELMVFAGLEPDDYQHHDLSYEDLLRTKEADLPDAAFMVSALPSAVAQTLVEKHGYRVAPLPYAAAFVRWRPGDGGVGVSHRHIHEAIIPALIYDREPPVPDEPVRTLGTRMLLLARADLDHEVVDRLMQAIFETPFSYVDDPPLKLEMLKVTPEVAWHSGTLQYAEQNKPLIAGDVLDSLEKEVSISAAVLGGLFCLWQWLRARFRRVRDRSFEIYILKVVELERQTLELEAAAVMNLPRLLAIQRELGQLKTEALERFAAGELGGEELMSGFLTQVNDVRSLITRLILHERDNLEEIAQLQGRTPEALWSEALAPPVNPAEPS